MADASTAIMNSVVEFFRKCPVLNEDGTFSVDTLPEKTLNYAFSYVPSTRVRKTYLDGSTVRQFNFTLSSNEIFDQETAVNLQNSAFYDQLSDWVEDQDKEGNLPTLPNGMKAQHLYVTLPGHLESANGKTARYSIQMQLVYLRR